MFKRIDCPECIGSGVAEGGWRCERCDGDGYIIDDEVDEKDEDGEVLQTKGHDHG